MLGHIVKYIPGIAIVCILAGCGERVESVTILNYKGPRYEIVLDYSELSAGGPCTGPQLPSRYQSKYYLYVDKIEGTLASSEVILTHEKDGINEPWPQSNLKGAVNFSDGVITINLLVPHYRQDSTIEKYVEFRYNGKYTYHLKQ